ncbi:hypothetical protein LWM68_32585 [Niabella sp. W65]|nr:hypothetical protein [Niabella sp. W65]MCH7367083.1 hypothetical protein [Niabella sp. W65]ULT42760.1 hypothetical protein KRR40_04120 [Niabella sp. I65]
MKVANGCSLIMAMALTPLMVVRIARGTRQIIWSQRVNGGTTLFNFKKMDGVKKVIQSMLKKDILWKLRLLQRLLL